MTDIKEAHDKALIDASWAICKASGGAGRGACDPKHCVCHDEAIAPVLGYLASLEASGFVIVPKEATEDMREAGYRRQNRSGDAFKSAYRAMIAARPMITDGGDE